MICVLTLLSRTFSGFMILVSGTIVSATIVAGLIDLNTFCLHSSGHFGNGNGKGLQSFHCSEFLFLRLKLLSKRMGANLQGRHTVVIGGWSCMWWVGRHLALIPNAVNCNLMDNLVIFEATTRLEIIGREREIFGIKILLAFISLNILKYKMDWNSNKRDNQILSNKVLSQDSSLS